MFGELEIFLKEIDRSSKTFEEKHFEKVVVAVYYLGGKNVKPVKLEKIQENIKMSKEEILRVIDKAFKKGYLKDSDPLDKDKKEWKMTPPGRRYVENLLD